MITLRKFEMDDIPVFCSWIISKRFLMQFGGPLYQLENLETILKEEIEQMAGDTDHLLYSVIDEESQKVIGHMQIMYINETIKRAKLGRIVLGDKDYLGKGIGSQMVSKLVKQVFEQYAVDTIELNVYDFNIGAKKCYESIGFVEVGYIPEVVKIEDEVWGNYHMEIYRN